MNQTNIDNFGTIDFHMEWQSETARHTERYHGRKINFWRDIFPTAVAEEMMRQDVGETVRAELGPGELLPKPEQRMRFPVKYRQIRPEFVEIIPEPRKGRFYPKGMLSDVANVFKENMEPFRCMETDQDRFIADFNHPLAGRAVRLSATVRELWEKESDTGGSCQVWPEIITDGPGMQARGNGGPTDFFSGGAFERDDARDDGLFYQAPRFVNHIDDTAIDVIRALYGSLLEHGDRVLDLMSSWTSHLPEGLEASRVTGLGMNAEELAANKRLTDFLVHDLNENPSLPLEDGGYDAVICTVSVEYLIHPFEVFRELHRVLAPNGLLVTTFSNRWFPPKAIQVWRELHEFERMGLVLEYFLDGGRFTNLETISVRGLPRPKDDRYYGERFVSDPVYAVWGYKSA